MLDRYDDRSSWLIILVTAAMNISYTSSDPSDSAHHEVLNSLRSVIDPEVGLNIVDMGLVYKIEISPAEVHVLMTMTSPGCPMSELIIEQAMEILRGRYPEPIHLVVELTFEPPWSPALMSEEAKAHLGW